MTEDWMHSLNFSHSLNIIKMIVVWFKNILSKGKKKTREKAIATKFWKLELKEEKSDLENLRKAES